MIPQSNQIIHIEETIFHASVTLLVKAVNVQPKNMYIFLFVEKEENSPPIQMFTCLRCMGRCVCKLSSFRGEFAHSLSFTIHDIFRVTLTVFVMEHSTLLSSMGGCTEQRGCHYAVGCFLSTSTELNKEFFSEFAHILLMPYHHFVDVSWGKTWKRIQIFFFHPKIMRLGSIWRGIEISYVYTYIFIDVHFTE